MVAAQELLEEVGQLRRRVRELPATVDARDELVALVDRLAERFGSGPDPEEGGSLAERLGLVAAGIANDFNNVLMTVLGNAEVALAALPAGDRNRQPLEEIARAAQRGGGLTRQMLATLRGVIVATKPADPSQAAASGTEGWGTRSAGLVLLVDDDPQVQNVARKMLEMQGFSVKTAGDGREGVNLFRQHSAEVVLVVLDLVMAGMRGDEAFSEMRRIRPDVRVILSTGYDEAPEREWLEASGLAGFIPKPYRLKTLRETVRRVLANG